MNEIIQLPADLLGANKGGVLYAANASRFDNGNLSQPLSNLATTIAEKDPILEVLNSLFPAVAAPRRFTYIAPTNAEEFLSEADDVRAIGGEHKRVESRGTEIEVRLDNKGLTIRLDKDGEGALPGATERAVAQLTNRLFRNDLRRGLTALLAAATNTGKNWNPSSDPDVDIADDLQTGGDTRGVDANIIIAGGAAWLTRKRAYRGQAGAGGFASASMSPDELATSLGLDMVKVVRNRYQATRGASSKTALLTNTVLSYYAQFNGGISAASNIVRYYEPLGGGNVQVYVEDKPKFIDVTVEHYGKVVIPTSLGIRSLTITNTAPAS